MHRRRRIVVAVATATMAASGVLAGTAAAAEPDAGRSAGAAAGQAAEKAAGQAAGLEWGECPTGAPGLECATVEVPLDYSDPEGRTIEVAVSRLPASDPEQRRGVLLLNPGGPGGPGLDLPYQLAVSGMPASVLDGYDLIGFDPRGVGHSAPLSCGFTAEQELAIVPGHAKDAEDVAAQSQVAAELVQLCLDAHPDDYLPHFTTANTARDMDVIRQALGEERISYLGYSYGTYLGAVYAQLFPERTDRVILDSAVAPEWVWRDEFRAWGLSGELAFADFAEWAAERNGTYELGATPEEVRSTYFELAERLDEEPLDTYDGSTFRWTTFRNLYSEVYFPALAQVWQDVKRSDPAALAASLTEAGIAAADGRASGQETQEVGAAQVPVDNSTSALATVLCSDVRWPTDIEHYQQAVARDGKRFPMFGGMAANMWPCAAWPDDPVEPPVEVDETAAQNGVLILQNLRDPATIAAGAVQLRQALGDESRLVLADEGGHGVFLMGGNACAWNIATRYLVDGELPERDAYCEDGAEPKTLRQGDDERREAVLRELHSRQPLL